MGMINFKYASLKFKDGTGTPNTFTVIFGEGNFSYTEAAKREYVLDRGVLATGSVRNGDDEPVSINVEGMWTEMRAASGGAVTLEEALKKLGAASAWVSTAVDACEPYCTDMVFEYGAECSGTLGHRLTFPMFRHEQLDYDAKAGTVKLTGKAKCTQPTIIRTAVS